MPGAPPVAARGTETMAGFPPSLPPENPLLVGKQDSEHLWCQKAALGLCQVITKQQACGPPRSPSREPYLSQVPFGQPERLLLIPPLHSPVSFPCSSPRCFPVRPGWEETWLPAHGRSLLGGRVPADTSPEPESTPSGEVDRSHWPRPDRIRDFLTAPLRVLRR